MKKLLSFIIICTCIVSTTALSFANEINSSSEATIPFKNIASSISIEKKAIYDKMTENQIDNKIREIDNKYEVGEELSLEDTEFISYEATKNINFVNTMSRKTKSRTRTTGQQTVISAKKYGTKVYFDNQSWVHVPYIFGECYFKTEATAHAISGKKNIKSITLITYHTAYGIVGSGGIGKVYSGTLNSGSQNSGFSMSLKKKYSASAAYTTIYTTAIVNTTKGKFNFSTNTSKWYW